MNLHRMLTLACGALLAATTAGQAQEKPAQEKPAQERPTQPTQPPAPKNTAGNGGVAFAVFARPEGKKELVKHGAFVRVPLKKPLADGTKTVEGTLVWSDPSTGRVFVRDQKGRAPQAVRLADVRDDIAVNFAAGEPGTPELFVMTVRNGPHTTRFFYEEVLSPGERDQLRALERAGNDIVQKNNMVESLGLALQEAATEPPVSVVQTGAPAYNYPAYVYPYYYPIAYYNLYYYLYYPMYPGFAYGGYPGLYSGYAGGGGGSTVVVQNSGSNAQSVAALTKSLKEARTALAEAEKSYVAVAQRAIYDPEGRIVAVRLED